MAKNELAKLKAGRFNSDNVKRYAGALRTAAPCCCCSTAAT